MLENILKVREEARTRHPNLNFDEMLEELFESYLDAKHHRDKFKMYELKEEAKILFGYMVDLKYTPMCVGAYQHIWEAVTEDGTDQYKMEPG